MHLTPVTVVVFDKNQKVNKSTLKDVILWVYTKDKTVQYLGYSLENLEGERCLKIYNLTYFYISWPFCTLDKDILLTVDVIKTYVKFF